MVDGQPPRPKRSVVIIVPRFLQKSIVKSAILEYYY